MGNIIKDTLTTDAQLNDMILDKKYSELLQKILCKVVVHAKPNRYYYLVQMIIQTEFAQL